MNHIQAMLSTHPRRPQLDAKLTSDCLEACSSCADVCNTCADACLAEPMVKELVRCIRLNLDCSAICAATASALARLNEPEWSVIAAQLRACQLACAACAAECEKHAAQHQHCRVCAESCRRCEQACAALLAKVPASA